MIDDLIHELISKGCEVGVSSARVCDDTPSKLRKRRKPTSKEVRLEKANKVLDRAKAKQKRVDGSVKPLEKIKPINSKPALTREEKAMAVLNRAKRRWAV